jgi:hypothetical protein
MTHRSGSPHTFLWLVLAASCGSSSGGAPAPQDTSTGAGGSSMTDTPGASGAGSETATDEPAHAQLALRTDTPSVRQFGTLLASPVDGSPLVLPEGALLGQIGGVDVPVTVLQGQLAILIPGVAPGNQRLTVQLGERIGVLDLNIEAVQAVTDVDATLERRLAELLQRSDELRAFLDPLVSAGTMPLAESVASEESRAALERYAAQLAGLDAEQRASAAATLEALLPLLEEPRALFDEMSGMLAARYEGEDTMRVLATKFIQGLILLVTPTVLGAIAGGTLTAFGGVPQVGAAAGAWIATAIFADYIRDTMRHVGSVYEAMVRVAFREDELWFDELRADWEFQSGSAHPIALGVNYRNLQAEDESSEVTWLTDLFGAVRKLQWLWGIFSPGTAAPALPARATVEADADGLSFISILVEGNSAVTGSIQGTPERPELVFSSSASGQQSFSFRLRYDDGEFPVESELHSGVVSAGNCVDSEFPYSGERVLHTRECYDQDGSHILNEACTTTAGACTGWSRSTVGKLPSGDPTLIDVLQVDQDSYAKQHYTQLGYAASIAGYTLLDGAVSLSRTDYIWSGNECSVRGRSWSATAGACDSGVMPGAYYSNGNGCYSGPGECLEGSVALTTGDIESMNSLTFEDVALLQEGTCGPPESCPFAGGLP